MTQKVNKGVKKVFRSLKAFSLVELIIVIAIIAILSVVGFLTLQKRISQSRDSARLSDLETIKKSLTVSYADSSTSETYPMPDEAETVTGEDGETVWYQGYFGDNAMEQIDNLNKLPKDPLGTGYEYSVTTDQQTYEVYAKLENGEKVSLLTNKAYAEEGRHIAKEGNYNGYIVGTDGTKYNLYNSPSLYLSSGTQLTSGAVNNVYQEGEAADSSVTVTGVDITDLKDDDTSNDDTVYDKVKNKFGLETVDEAEKVVKRADGGKGNFVNEDSNETLSFSDCEELTGDYSKSHWSSSRGMAVEDDGDLWWEQDQTFEFYKYNGDGTWKHDSSKDFSATSTCGMEVDENYIYVTTCDSTVYKYDKDNGNQVWSVNVGDNNNQGVVKSADGSYLYIGTYSNGYIYKLDLNGNEISHCNLTSDTLRGATYDYDKGIFFFNSSDSLYEVSDPENCTLENTYSCPECYFASSSYFHDRLFLQNYDHFKIIDSYSNNICN